MAVLTSKASYFGVKSDIHNSTSASIKYTKSNTIMQPSLFGVEAARLSLRFSKSTNTEIMFINVETMVIHMSIDSFTSSLQALISSSSLFAFHSTQLLNTDSSLIHATQRLRMIVPSVHTFAGFKLLSSSFADDRSIGAYICGLQTLILQNMLNHSLLQFLGLNFVFRAGVGHLSPLRDHRIHNVSSSRERAEPTGLAIHRVHPRVVGIGSAVLKHDVSSSREQAQPAGPGLLPCSDPTRFPPMESIRLDSVHALRLDAHPTQRIDSTRIQHNKSTRRESSAANRLNSADAGMRLRLGWNDPRISTRLDVHGAGLGMQRMELRCPRPTPIRTPSRPGESPQDAFQVRYNRGDARLEIHGGSGLRVACDVRPLLAYAIRRPGRAANRGVWGVFHLRVTRFVTDSPRLDVHATPTCDSAPTTRLEHGAATRDSAWEAFEAAAGIDS
ncbi:hypothetical protein C8R43DRAFT_1125031 [Mycena crocata]|nr:hypothetical protein C8R43DRAFT_1125031 [Mycena crocata]